MDYWGTLVLFTWRETVNIELSLRKLNRPCSINACFRTVFHIMHSTNNVVTWLPVGVPGGANGKEPICYCRRLKWCVFGPWVRKIPWRREWKPTPVFLPGQSHGQRTLAGCGPQTRLQRVGHNWSDLAGPHATCEPYFFLGIWVWDCSICQNTNPWLHLQGAWYISQAGWLRVYFFFFAKKKKHRYGVFCWPGETGDSRWSGGISDRFRKWTSPWQLTERHSWNSWNVTANAPSLKKLWLAHWEWLQVD